MNRRPLPTTLSQPAATAIPPKSAPYVPTAMAVSEDAPPKKAITAMSVAELLMVIKYSKASAEDKASASHRLWSESALANGSAEIVMQGGIKPVLLLLEHGATPAIKINAASVLCNLSIHEKYREPLMVAGAVDVKMRLIAEPSNPDELKELAIQTLGNIAIEHDVRRAMETQPNIVKLLEIFKATALPKLREGILNLLHNFSLSVNAGTAGLLSQPNVLSLLIATVKDNSSAPAQVSAAKALYQLTKNAQNRNVLSSAGVIPLLGQIVHKKIAATEEVQELSYGVLAELAIFEPKPETLSQIMAANVLLIAFADLRAPSCSAARREKTARLLYGLCHHSNDARQLLFAQTPLSSLFALIKSSNDAADPTCMNIRDMVAAVVYALCESKDAKIHSQIVSAGVVEVLLPILDGKSYFGKGYVTAAFSHLRSGESSSIFCRRLADAKGIAKLAGLLKDMQLPSPCHVNSAIVLRSCAGMAEFKSQVVQYVSEAELDNFIKQ